MQQEEVPKKQDQIDQEKAASTIQCFMRSKLNKMRYLKLNEGYGKLEEGGEIPEEELECLVTNKNEENMEEVNIIYFFQLNLIFIETKSLGVPTEI